MGRTAKPRRAYRPRAIDADPIGLAIGRIAALQDAQRRDLITPVRSALSGLRTGTGGMDAWRTLADATNVAEQLCALGIASDRLATIDTAQAALAELHARHMQRGTWTARAAELAALEEAVVIHGIQLRFASQGEVAEAIQTVQRRVAAALAGNASPRARVCVGVVGTPTSHPQEEDHESRL